MERDFTEVPEKVSPVPEHLRLRYFVEVFDKDFNLYASFASREFILDDIDVRCYLDLDLGYTVKVSKL